MSVHSGYQVVSIVEIVLWDRARPTLAQIPVVYVHCLEARRNIWHFLPWSPATASVLPSPRSRQLTKIQINCRDWCSGRFEYQACCLELGYSCNKYYGGSYTGQAPPDRACAVVPEDYRHEQLGGKHSSGFPPVIEYGTICFHIWIDRLNIIWVVFLFGSKNVLIEPLGVGGRKWKERITTLIAGDFGCSFWAISVCKLKIIGPDASMIQTRYISCSPSPNHPH